MINQPHNMQQSDTSSYYPYYQPHLQNPNPSSDPPNPNPFPATYASAPPVVSNFPSSDYSAYSSYPQYADHAPNPPPPPPLSYSTNPSSQSYSNPSPQPYAFPHLNPQPTPYYPHDQNQAALNYDHANPGLDSNPNSSFPSNSYSPVTNYESLYEIGTNYGRYGDQGLFGDAGKQRPDIGIAYGGFGDGDGVGVGGDGVYAYSGGSKEPYGAGGSGSESSSRVIFDDYGRPIGFSDGKEQSGSGQAAKVVKAIPKTEPPQDMGSGVQKFRVKLLSEGPGQSDMDVLCQVGLDGIRILDPATSRTLRIYPLETVTRWEILDSYIFAFWAKSSVDIQAKRNRLKSNSYTSNNILDTVAAATFQFKEIGGSSKPSDTLNASEQPSERKKGFADWMNIMKPQNEEKDHWVPDEAVVKCSSCGAQFNAFIRRHHCRNCGDIFCDKCTQGRIALTADDYAVPVRVCDRCMAEVTQRLANANRKVTPPPQSHEDLAKKLKEEMEKNRKASSGLTSSASSGTRMKEVACPTCTVHLQVQVPALGSETIECSVCQHPFLVSAH